MHASIIEARSEKGKGWDEALVEVARLQDDRVHSMTLQDRMQNAPSANNKAKRTYVMLFNDDEDDSPSLVYNTTNRTEI